MGGRALLSSGTGILFSDGEPKVCANDGSDWGGWVAMSPCGLDMDTWREVSSTGAAARPPGEIGGDGRKRRRTQCRQRARNTRAELAAELAL